MVMWTCSDLEACLFWSFIEMIVVRVKVYWYRGVTVLLPDWVIFK